MSSARRHWSSAGLAVAVLRGKICMTGMLLVDTDVFVYSRNAREPHKRPLARQWLQ